MDHKANIQQAFDDLGAGEVLRMLADAVNESLNKFDLEQFESDRVRVAYLKAFDAYLQGKVEP